MWTASTGMHDDFQLPEHWVEVDPEEDGDFFWTTLDGLDYTRPAYVRRDGRAVIHHNMEPGEANEYLFAIVFEDESDCTATLEDALETADEYVDSWHPEPFYLPEVDE